MNHIRINKRIVITLLFSITILLFSGCSKNTDISNSLDNTLPTKNEPTATPTIDDENSGLSNDTNDPENTSNPYTMSSYTEAANDNSSISIQYPVFSGDDYKNLNAMIYNKAVSIGQLDPDVFSEDTGLTADYVSEVTLLNNKVVSIIFWGSSYVEGGAYPTTNLFTLNVDLQTMKEIKLNDLYRTNDDFVKTFFEKATFPTNPITSYDIESFPEMLKLQSEEHQTVNQFEIENGVRFYLKPDGIVLSLFAIHATGSDHFDAFLSYNDIDKFYLPSQKYWEVE